MARALKASAPKAVKPSKPKILIFGKAGVGKTWAAIDFPSVYYIDTEGGANLGHYTDKLSKSGGMYLGPESGANDFSTIIEEVITLATTQHKFKTLVIDSYSKLFSSQVAATAETMEKNGKKNEFGADKKPAVSMSRRLVRWLDQLDMNVILICHERPVWKDGQQMGVTFDGWDKMEYELHLALNIIKAGESRKARVTKTRLQQFQDAELFDWSFASFAEKYGRDIMEADATPIAMATPEQIARYNELLQSVKVDPAILEKWDENCDNIADLDAEGMKKRLDYLTAKLPKSA